MLISERIYKYLEERKMSQMEFADRTGISQSTVSDWRRKGTNPYVVIDRNSKEYGLIESYQKLNLESQKRLEGYLTALREMK